MVAIPFKSPTCIPSLRNAKLVGLNSSDLHNKYFSVHPYKLHNLFNIDNVRALFPCSIFINSSLGISKYVATAF